jgi:hypothetical protein
MADFTDRLAGNADLGSRHSLDNGSHGRLELETVALFQFASQLDLARIGSRKGVDDLTLHRDDRI